MPYAARLDYLGLLDLWTMDRPRIGDWRAQACEWPSFKAGLVDLVSAAEFTEMRLHGRGICDGVAAFIAGLRRCAPTD